MTSDDRCARTWLILAHSALYLFPLKLAEVRARYWRLPTERGARSVPTSNEVSNCLRALVREGRASSYQGYYTTASLADLKAWVKRRRISQVVSDQKRLEAEQLVRWLARLPWVWGIALTGSVAMNSAQSDEDTDFFIVTARHRLWLTRFLVFLYALRHGKRRSFAREEPESWCFNLWLEADQLAMPLVARSLYTAYEVCQVEWLLARHATARHFLIANYWVSLVLPLFYRQKWRAVSPVPADQPFSPVPSEGNQVLHLLFSPIWFVLNLLAYLAQRLYMAPHQTRERIAYSLAFFHPLERSRALLTNLIQQTSLTFVRRPSFPQAGERRVGRVLVTGVFDLLHSEHLAFLRKARQLGDFLVIALESDERVRVIKGEGRPVNSARVRQQALEGLGIAEEVIILPAEFGSPEVRAQFLLEWQPQILAVSAHTAHLPQKRQMMKAVGGRVVIVHPHNPAISTTRILKESGGSRG